MKADQARVVSQNETKLIAKHLERFVLDDELFINYADKEVWNNDGTAFG